MRGFSWQALWAEAGRTWAWLRAGGPADFFSRETANGLVELARPVGRFHDCSVAAPVVGAAGLILGVLLAGVALASLGSLLASLLALAFLLSEVFGVTIELGEFASPV